MTINSGVTDLTKHALWSKLQLRLLPTLMRTWAAKPQGVEEPSDRAGLRHGGLHRWFQTPCRRSTAWRASRVRAQVQICSCFSRPSDHCTLCGSIEPCRDRCPQKRRKMWKKTFDHVRKMLKMKYINLSHKLFLQVLFTRGWWFMGHISMGNYTTCFSRESLW